MFDEQSMREWLNGLTGNDKEYVKWFVHRAFEHGEESLEIALINARKTVIFRNAIGVIAYGSLKTPEQVFNELIGS